MNLKHMYVIKNKKDIDTIYGFRSTLAIQGGQICYDGSSICEKIGGEAIIFQAGRKKRKQGGELSHFI